MWHSRLDHSSLPIFQKFLSVLSIYFPEEHLCSFSYSFYSINKATSYLLLNQASPLPLHLMSSFLMCELRPFHLLMVFITTLFLLIISQSKYGFIHYDVNQMFIQPLFPSSNLLKIISPPPVKHFTPIMGVNS